MKKKEKNTTEIREELFNRYPQLENCKDDIISAFDELVSCYKRGGKLIVAGNGGSAADSEHIVGELLKSFLFLRKINSGLKENLSLMFDDEGRKLADTLEGAFPAIPLTSMSAINTAFANDSEPSVSFAQTLNALSTKEDVFLGITTSGNSKNIIYSLMVAKAKGVKSIVLTGGTGGKCKEIADITICVNEIETFKIQELHLPIYHALCAMLEAEIFEEK